MRHFPAAWPSLFKKIGKDRTLFLMLDFDGTLVRIARTPEEVVLEEKTRHILEKLSRSPRRRIAIISGRSLKWLKSFVRLKRVIYAGNHGLELSGAPFSLPLKAVRAKRLEALIWLVGEKLREDFQNFRNVMVEDKGYTLSLHFRNLGKDQLPFFRKKVAHCREMYAKWPLVWRMGKKVWEVRPAVQWDKGNAALFLSKKFPKAVPIVIGDDDTDEDMFQALRTRGITVRVGRSARSWAKFYLRSFKDVQMFLTELELASRR